MGRMRLSSVGLGGIARCRSPPFFLSISLVFRKPKLKLDFTKKIRLAQGRSLFLAKPSLFLGGTERKKVRGATMHGTSRPCLRGTVERATHECCRVGRANNSNAFGLFFEQESQRYLTFTMIRTPSSYGGARGDLYHQYDDGNGNQKHDRGLRDPR